MTLPKQFDIGKLSERQYDAAVSWIRDVVGIDTANADDINMHVTCMFSTADFGATFMPGAFYLPDTAQQLDFNPVLDDESKAKTVREAYRGFSKTTRISAKSIKDMLYRVRRFPLWIGQNEDLATQDAEIVKEEILTNDLIRDIFGKLEPTTYRNVRKSISKTMWYLADPRTSEPFAFFLPRGARQAMRGIRARLGKYIVRPDLVLVNDLEDDRYIDSEDHRNKTRSWFYATLLRIVDMNHEKMVDHPTERAQRLAEVFGKNMHAHRFLYVDTRKHDDAMICHLLQHPDWDAKSYPVGTIEVVGDKEVAKTLVPERFTDKELQQIWDRSVEHRVADETARELFCMSSAPSQRTFARSMFRYYDDEKKRFTSRDDVFKCVMVDPARTINKKSAETAVLAWALDESEAKLYIRRALGGHWGHSEGIKRTLDLCVETGTRNLACEDTGLGDHIVAPYRLAAEKRGLDINFIWLKPHGVQLDSHWGHGREAVKRARAAQALPFYEAGEIYHDHLIDGSPLEQQMLSFPRPRRWDYLDLIGYIAQVIEVEDLVFEPQRPDITKGEEAEPDFGDWDDYAAHVASVEAGDWMLI